MNLDTLKTPLPDWVPNLVVAAMGAAVLGIAIVLVVLQLRAQEDTVATVGVVVEDTTVHRYDRKNTGYVAMQVAYHASNGHEYRVVAHSYRDHRDLPRGSAVPVRYFREHPDVAYVDTFKEVWRMPLLIGAAGALLTLVGGRLAWLARQRDLERRRTPAAGPSADDLRRSQ
jgi:hypothetical protein